MAERSTAAVDVAAGGGSNQPPHVEAEKSAVDGMAGSPERDTASSAVDGTDQPPESPTSDGHGKETAGSTGVADTGDDTPAAPDRPAASGDAVALTPDAGKKKGTARNASNTGGINRSTAGSNGTGSRNGTRSQGGRTGGRSGGNRSRTGNRNGGKNTRQKSARQQKDGPQKENRQNTGTSATARPGGRAQGKRPATRSSGAPTTSSESTTSRSTAETPAVHEPAKAARPTRSAQPAATTTPPVPELHSGFKLARRYRLEECLTRLDGFSSWRAVDEKLRRAVGVHVLPADHPRARSVLAAARSSALLGDPRFVQVLDAVEEDALVYVVHEWLPDATELTALLASGPLEVHDCYQMVTQVTQAMTAAHREGLAHLRLTPGAVLRTSSGQWRVRGLAVNAALRGISSDTPQRTDTEAIGALLYAALTCRWPYENDAYGLSGLPKGVGLIAPDQVRAGIHRGLSELAMRALVNDGATASRQEPPCTTPEELLAAISAMPKIRPPEPTFTPPPVYRRTTYQQGSYRRTPTRGAAPDPVVAPPPTLESRTGKALKWGVSALLIVALGLGSWQLADALLHRSDDSGDHGRNGQEVGGSDEKPSRPSKPLKIVSAREFAPTGSGINEDDVQQAVDGNKGTAWVTPHYENHPNFGNLPTRKDGSGIIVDLGSVQEVTGFDLALYRGGQKLEVRAAAADASTPTTLNDFPQRLTSLNTVDKHLMKKMNKTVRTRYVLVHITSLPPEAAQNQYRGGISEIKILGTPSE